MAHHPAESKVLWVSQVAPGERWALYCRASSVRVLWHLQGLVVDVGAPMCAIDSRHRSRLQQSGVGQVRPMAQIHLRTSSRTYQPSSSGTHARRP